jgi:hypothetical protein
MTRQTVKKVPLSSSTVSACLCPQCPVQEKSKCVAGLKPGVSAALKKEPLNKDEIPGVYCGTGKAACTDLNPAQPCVCASCALYPEYNLAAGKPDLYYCTDGVPR